MWKGVLVKIYMSNCTADTLFYCEGFKKKTYLTPHFAVIFIKIGMGPPGSVRVSDGYCQGPIFVIYYALQF